MFQNIPQRDRLLARKLGKLKAQEILADRGISTTPASPAPKPTVTTYSEFLVPLPDRTCKRLQERGAALDHGYFNLKMMTFLFVMARSKKEQDCVNTEMDQGWGWKHEPLQIIRLSLRSDEASEFSKMSIERQAAVLRLLADRELRGRNWFLH
ncbi:MAG: hypothetical protein HC860_26090 [Alkalinema sp. RU_4_3]|nr:hypothetical protein [Alkalinema sp. RU_4_3]